MFRIYNLNAAKNELCFTHVNEYLNLLYQWYSGHDLSLIRDMDMVGQPGSADGDQPGPSARQEFHIMINLMSLRWDTL